MSAVADDQDKLSDYIPQSNEVSRAPSKQVSVKGSDNEDEDEIDDDDEQNKEEYDEQEYDGDGDVEMGSTPAKKRAADKAAERKAATGSKRAQKQDREVGVRRPRSRPGNHASLTDCCLSVSQFAARKDAQAALKSADSIKRFAYLLGQTDLFRHFCDLKAERDPEFAAMLEESEKQLGKGKASAAKKGKVGARGRKTEKEEDDELLAATKTADDDDSEPFVFTESPACEYKVHQHERVAFC